MIDTSTGLSEKKKKKIGAHVANKVYSDCGNRSVLEIVPPDALRILDVGCGSGTHAEMLRADRRSIDGITLSEAEARAAEKFCRRVWVHNLENGLPVVIDERYDCVICSHVLEHICFPDRLLKDLLKALRAEGKLIVALPNIFHYRYRLQLLLGRFDYEEAGVMDYTHLRWYSFDSARALLTRNGFKILCAVSEGDFPFYITRKLLPAKMVRGISGAAGRLFPGLFSRQIILIAQPQ